MSFGRTVNFRIIYSSTRLNSKGAYPSPYFHPMFVSNTSVKLLLTLSCTVVWNIVLLIRLISFVVISKSSILAWSPPIFAGRRCWIPIFFKFFVKGSAPCCLNSSLVSCRWFSLFSLFFVMFHSICYLYAFFFLSSASWHSSSNHFVFNHFFQCCFHSAFLVVPGVIYRLRCETIT